MMTMAQVLLLGTWLTRPGPAADDIIAAGDDVKIGGMSGQMLLTGSRIVVKRPWIVDDRTWKHGMARAVQDGEIQELTDEQLVVVDARPEPNGGRGRRR
jgi:hypothetical protein